MTAHRLTYGVSQDPEAPESRETEQSHSVATPGQVAPTEALPRVRSDADPEAFALMFKALGNPHRMQIFLRLAEPGPDGGLREIAVGDLGGQLDIARSTLSHHLRELQAGGLVRTRRQTRSILCRLEPRALLLLSSLFQS